MSRYVPGKYLHPIRPHIGELRLWDGDTHGWPRASLALLCTYRYCDFFLSFAGVDEASEATQQLLDHYLAAHPGTIDVEDE